MNTRRAMQCQALSSRPARQTCRRITAGGGCGGGGGGGLRRQRRGCMTAWRRDDQGAAPGGFVAAQNDPRNGAGFSATCLSRNENVVEVPTVRPEASPAIRHDRRTLAA